MPSTTHVTSEGDKTNLRLRLTVDHTMPESFVVLCDGSLCEIDSLNICDRIAWLSRRSEPKARSFRWQLCRLYKTGWFTFIKTSLHSSKILLIWWNAAVLLSARDAAWLQTRRVIWFAFTPCAMKTYSQTRLCTVAEMRSSQMTTKQSGGSSFWSEPFFGMKALPCRLVFFKFSFLKLHIECLHTERSEKAHPHQHKTQFTIWLESLWRLFPCSIHVYFDNSLIAKK